jgi:hypothetical protein
MIRQLGYSAAMPAVIFREIAEDRGLADIFETDTD